MKILSSLLFFSSSLLAGDLTCMSIFQGPPGPPGLAGDVGHKGDVVRMENWISLCCNFKSFWTIEVVFQCSRVIIFQNQLWGYKKKKNSSLCLKWAIWLAREKDTLLYFMQLFNHTLNLDHNDFINVNFNLCLLTSVHRLSFVCHMANLVTNTFSFLIWCLMWLRRISEGWTNLPLYQ